MNRKDPFGEGPTAAQARRRRNIAIALGLVLFIVLVFSTTMIRLGQNLQRQAPAATTVPVR